MFAGIFTQIKDPFCFYGSIAAGHQREKFAVLKQEINNYFCNEQLMKPVLSYPEAGKVKIYICLIITILFKKLYFEALLYCWLFLKVLYLA